MSSPVAPSTEHEHPWSRRYAEQGRERPQLIEFKRPAPAMPAEPTAAPAPGTAEALAKVMWDDPPPEVELVNAARLAEIASEIEARHHRDRVGMFKLLGVAAVFVFAVMGLFEAWQFLGNGRASPERLAAEAEAVGRHVLAAHASAAQPMAIGAVRMEERPGARAGRADYDVIVTLRLTENLFGPADSNGAQPYLLMQQSVEEAADRMRRDRLFLDNPALADPVRMPRLLALSHRAGERAEVRVRLASERVGWSWRLQPRLEQVAADRLLFAGRVLSQYADEPFLVFGSSAAREQMRGLIAEGRRYVLAVNGEVAGRRVGGPFAAAQ
ncbi:MAG TPA: hypothetical protein VEB66_00485 [Opitutaceae bacterium]|nr:hypothetical protein [Opitutaceae bacterium]